MGPYRPRPADTATAAPDKLAAMSTRHQRDVLDFYIDLVGRDRVARCLRLPSEELVQRFGDLDGAEAARALRRLQNRTA